MDRMQKVAFICHVSNMQWKLFTYWSNTTYWCLTAKLWDLSQNGESFGRTLRLGRSAIGNQKTTCSMSISCFFIQIMATKTRSCQIFVKFWKSQNFYFHFKRSKCPTLGSVKMCQIGEPFFPQVVKPSNYKWHWFGLARLQAREKIFPPWLERYAFSWRPCRYFLE